MEVGEVIKQAIDRKGYTMRDITRISGELERRQPKKYSALSRQTVVNVCKSGYINKDRPSFGIVNSIVEILWDGNMRKFHEDTNFIIHGEIVSVDSTLSSMEIERVLYFEGKLPPKQANEKDFCPFSGADFLFQSTGVSLDFLGPDQKSGCISVKENEPLDKHSLVILSRKTGLEAAWFLDRNTYCNRRGTFFSTDEIFGKIVWTIPKYSANFPINIQVENEMLRPDVKPLNWPLSIKTREEINKASNHRKIDAKSWVSKAISDFIENLDMEEFIKIKLPVTREGEMFPRVTYKIEKALHDQISSLASDLTIKSGRKYTRGMLATYAVERALKEQI